MSSVVKGSEYRRFPTIIATGAIAAAVTMAWGAGMDISPLIESAEIRRGELWRLITSAFPHVSVWHLAANLYWLWEFGRPIEEKFGHTRTALLLAFFAAVSAAFDFALANGGVGLSGVVYGFFGLLWILSRHDDRFLGTLSRSTILLFVGWFALCIVATEKRIFPVANVAHAAGLLFGVLLGALMLTQWPRFVGAGIGLLTLFGIWGATIGRPIVNLSGAAGYDEAKWGYDALLAHRDQEAVEWLRDAVRLQPDVASNWVNLGIAYKRLGDVPASTAAYGQARQLMQRSPERANYEKMK